MNKYHIFYDESLNDYLKNLKKDFYALIEKEEESTILNADEAYIDSITKKYIKYLPEFKFNEFNVEAVERTIGGNIQTAFIYEIPFIGNENLLKLRPSNFLEWSILVEVKYIKDNKVLVFEIIDNGDDVEKIRSKFEVITRNIQTQLKNINSEIEEYNDQLPILIKDKVEERKTRILEREKKLKSLKSP